MGTTEPTWEVLTAQLKQANADYQATLETKRQWQAASYAAHKRGRREDAMADKALCRKVLVMVVVVIGLTFCTEALINLLLGA